MADTGLENLSLQDSRLPTGPQAGVKYPLQIVYCGVCGLPPEYCEFNTIADKCRAWLKSNHPDLYEQLTQIADAEASAGAAEGEDGKKKRQTRGGKALIKAKKQVEPEGVKLWTQSRGKKKKVTIVQGLASYEIDLKKASKVFASKFSCGSSVSGEDEIVIQGDVKYDLFDILPEIWKVIDEDDIEDCGEKKG